MKNCKYFVETSDGNLCFCKHKENKEEYEGNCGKSVCPLGDDSFDILQQNADLLFNHNKIKRFLLSGIKNLKDV